MKAIGTATHSTYDPAIEGLRALAVISVIINHFNNRLLPSGNLGVDIFFVISGYVISLSLASRQERSFGEFILSFYARRMKRLVPALVACVVITSILICCFNPDPRISLKTGIAALFGLSNLYLQIQSADYFSPAAEVNVFTQTWSLGVEEQFYLVFPLLVWLTGMGRRRTGFKKLFFIITALCFASTIAFVFFSANNTSVAFYSMPARFWELGAGCLLFLTLKQRQPTRINFWPGKNSTLLLCLVIGVLFIPVKFSVTATIAAVLLTMLLIASIHPQSIAHATLTSRYATYIGRISYSLYLWHWTILSLSRWTIGIHWWTVPIQVGLMFVIAAASYTYLEVPLRRARWSRSSGKSIMYGLGASIGAALVAAILLNNHSSLLFKSRSIAPAFLPLMNSGLPYDPTCVVDANKRPLKAETFDLCTVLPTPSTLPMIWTLGDSHAGHLQGLLYAIHEKTGLGIHLIETPGVAFPFVRQSRFEPRSIIFGEIERNLRSGDIVLLARLFINRKSGKVVDDLQTWISDVTNLSADLSPQGVSVVVMGPPPIFEFPDINTCVSSFFGDSSCERSRSSISAEIEDVYRQLEQAEKSNENLYVFNQFDILCPKSNLNCTPLSKQGFLFRDKDHLNSLGAASLSADFIGYLHQKSLLQQ